MRLTIAVVSVAALLGACAHESQPPAPAAVEAPMTKAEPAPPGSIFASPSSLPFQLPPFDQIKDADFIPAFEQGMADQLAEVKVIADNPAPPSFDNTVVALERSGAMLTRVNNVFSNLNGSNTNDELQKIDAEMSPKLAAQSDAINLDPKLFARIQTLYDERDSLKLDPESAELLDRYYKNFVQAGARLSPADKDKLRAYNEKLSSLSTQFQQNVLASTKSSAVIVDDVKQLEGLSPQQIGAAAEAAKARGLDGKWVLPLQNTTQQPVLAQLANRSLRERIFKASENRGQGGSSDNLPVISQIIRLRAESARLMGYPTAAAYILQAETAKTPEAVNKLMAQMAPAALAKAKREEADIQKQIDADAKLKHQPSFKLQPWDWAYYAEQVRQKRYAFDEAEVKPYFELNHVLQDGVFYAAHELYGLTFKERTDLPVYQKDVRVFEVFDADGSPLGLFLADYFARDNKNGGAWESAYVSASRLLGTQPVVVNNVNIPKPADGQPVLLTFDEVTTLFHEFGHAMHDMLSTAKYPLLSGTNVPPDFVEFPSQYNEMWGREPKVIAHYAKDYRTGAPMPKALLDKVLAAQKFDQGFALLEYMEAAMLDQSWHQIQAEQAPAPDQVMAFEAAALVKDGVSYAPVPPRYHSPYFSHIFGGGYSAGYYAYLWSEVLARDTEYWFHTHGGLTRENGMRLREMVLSRGHTEDPELLFEKFYGGKPDVKPLLMHRGLLPAGKPAAATKSPET